MKFLFLILLVNAQEYGGNTSGGENGGSGGISPLGLSEPYHEPGGSSGDSGGLSNPTSITEPYNFPGGTTGTSGSQSGGTDQVSPPGNGSPGYSPPDVLGPSPAGNTSPPPDVQGPSPSNGPGGSAPGQGDLPGVNLQWHHCTMQGNDGFKNFGPFYYPADGKAYNAPGTTVSLICAKVRPSLHPYLR